jgi:enoyl-CoA hydratase
MSEHLYAPSIDSLLVEREGAVATLTLNRPNVLNALNIALLRELKAAIESISADESIRAVILTGSGAKAFAAGADIAELNALGSAIAGEQLASSGQAVTRAFENARQPVIAAINGFALGGGCELAMAADIRIAADNAKFGQPEVNLGLIPGFGGTQRTARLFGRGMAMYLCLTAEIIDAQEALRIGLVQKVVPAAELLAEAKRIANAIASKAPLAITATKAAIDTGLGLTLEDGLQVEALRFGSVIGTADFAEGTKAFLEKRKPDFKGA